MTTPEDVARAARVAAAEAAAAAGVTIDPADGLDTQEELADLLAHVWETERESIVPLPLLRGLIHAGNWAVAVRRKGQLVGGGFGYVGLTDSHRHLHSHIVGFLADDRGRGCGYATKLHQRAWALERGIEEVTWTYDPLVRPNGGFNLTKLGAAVTTYLPDFYGRMPDGVNADDASDRMLVTWKLSSQRVRRALGGSLTKPARSDLLAAGATVLLDVDDDGRPVPGPPASGAVALAATPRDIITLRTSDAAVADNWRHAMRKTVGSAVAQGWVVSGMTTDGWYVLTRPSHRE